MRLVPNQAIRRPGRERHLDDDLGPQPMNVRQLKGEPKRLSRGGGASSGIVFTCSRFSTAASRFNSASVMPMPTRPA